MSASHKTGAQRGSRLGNEPTFHTIPIDFANHVSGTAYKVITFKVKNGVPLLIRANIVNAVADNSATSAVVSVGSASGGAQLISAHNLKSAQNTNGSMVAPAGAGLFFVYNYNDATLTNNSTLSIWMTVTRVGTPTAGRAYLVIEAMEVNAKKQTSSGAV